jgi:hypothetical protein
VGFYIRKSIRMGAVRLNLSKSGVGVSTGVTGFRVGVNGRGTYVHMGRGGLYYRKQLSWKHRPGGAPRSLPPSSPGAIVEPANSGVLFTENLAQPLDVHTNNADDSALLTHFRHHSDWSVLILVMAGLALLTSFESTAWTIGLSAIALLLFLLHVAQAHRGILIYDLDDQAIERYQTFVDSFASFFRSSRMWLYEEQAVTSDWKRNAGATWLIKRRLALALPEGDPKIRTNISIPCISSGHERIYFLPDAVVIRSGASLAAYRYSDFDLSVSAVVFVEEETVPSDASVVGHAWRYTRRDGGPDRRFNNNRQYPKCRYQSVKVGLAGRVSRVLAKSSIDDVGAWRSALRRLHEYTITLQSEPTAAPGAAPIVS